MGIVLSIIPARGGSRRLERKNLADLGERPLIGWAIDAAVASGCIDKLLVSTEDEEIARVASDLLPDWGGVWRRHERLARDDTPMLPVVLEIVQRMEGCSGEDVIVLLQPTSPFRTGADIAAALALLRNNGGDAVVSVNEAEPDLTFEMGWSRRLRPVRTVVPNGALYLITVEALLRGDDWYSGITYGYAMSKERSLDIDTPLDLEIARLMLARGEAA